jgi:radical SAM superfamily enzyme YgiQ (UPF0313 family)
MKKNFLLVYPRVPTNTFWSFKYSLKFLNKKSAMPPLGLITLAALMPADDYALKLVDMNVTPLKDEDIKWADAVLISAMIVQKDSFAQVVSRCNRLGTPVIAGGPYVTSSADDIQGADHLLRGEVEDSFADFLIDYQNGRAKKVYSAPQPPNIAQTKIPRFDLLDLKAYSSMSVQYSRGCPFTCEFCDIWKVYGNKPRLKSAKNMIAELDALYRLRWRGAVFLVDDNFIGNKRRVKNELLPALTGWQKKHRHAFHFYTEASINMADDEALLSAMRDAGFNQVFIGIESPSDDALKETGKHQNLKRDMGYAVQRIQHFGMEVMAGFILGFDSDADDIFDRQIRFIQQNGIPQAMVGLLTALPGTDLFFRLAKEGRILKTSGGNNTHCLETNFLTKMDGHKLRKGYRKVLAALYDINLKNYFSRCDRLLDNIGQTPFFQRNINIGQVQIFIKSFLRQPLTRYGFQYIKFLLRNAVKHRSFFAEAVRLGIIGHHFHIITRETIKIDNVSRYLDEKYRYLSQQIQQYSSRTRDNSKEAMQHITALWKQKKTILKQSREKIDRIHVDFRDDITKKYIDVSDRMKVLFASLEREINPFGPILR